MRNWTRCSGVYNNMLRVSLYLFCSLAAVAQPMPRQDPLDAALQAGWQAQGSGRFAEATAGREQALALLQHAPVDSPRFPSWVQQLAQLYQNSGWNARARTILQEALARTGPLGDSHPSHTAVLNALADSWRQDGNLLKAVGYLEQAATAMAAAPAPATTPPAGAVQSSFGGLVAFGSRRIYGGRYAVGGFPGSALYAYIRLADLYRQLGRPDAIAAVAVKIRTLASNDQSTLARFYEQQGQFGEAAAIYKKQAEQLSDPQARAGAWQSLASLAARQEHPSDAAAAMQQAIAAIQSSDNPGVRSQATWMRQNLAGYMRDAGQLEEADHVYRQILQESHGGPLETQMLGMYAMYLGETERGAQGLSLLKDYLAGNANLDPQQKMTALFNLSNVSRTMGDAKMAEEYQQAGQALQPQPPPPPEGQIQIGEELRKAQAALNQNRVDDAYSLVLNAIDAAAHASDGQQVEWLGPQLAQTLAAHKEPARADQLFRRLFALAQEWSVNNVQPLLDVTQNYRAFS
jgi:tetratricopeptide (TPR) repeat protein